MQLMRNTTLHCHILELLRDLTFYSLNFVQDITRKLQEVFFFKINLICNRSYKVEVQRIRTVAMLCLKLV